MITAPSPTSDGNDRGVSPKPVCRTKPFKKKANPSVAITNCTPTPLAPVTHSITARWNSAAPAVTTTRVSGMTSQNGSLNTSKPSKAT